MCLRNGRRAAGIVPAGSVTPVWTTYLSSDDVDATAEAMTQAGGTLTTGPADAGPAGRVVVGTDPLGASIGAWKGNEHPGTEIVDEVGTLVWTELNTPDLDAAIRFYSDVFGHTWADEDTGEGGPQYRVFSAAGQLAGGALSTDGGGSYWLPYFGVADTDATVAAAMGSGGSVLQGPQESAYGKMAVLRDPHGATFAVIEVPEAQS